VYQAEDINGLSGVDHELRADAGTVRRVASTMMPSSWGQLRVVAFRAKIGDILAVVSGLGDGRRVPVRVHDACLTGEAFGSLKCDCGLQLRMVLKVQTKRQLGVVVYMPQEGRGIGLANKIRAYSLQEEHGLDTVDANLALGLPAEMRDYSAVRYILEDLGVSSALLMTNNPFKVEQLRLAGVNIEGTLPVIISPLAQATSQYLETKRRRMGHLLPEAAVDQRAPLPELAGPAADLLSKLRAEIHRHAGERPFTLLSFAASLDGFIAGVRSKHDGSSERYPVALSGKAAALLTHHLRGSVDAILVGLGTVQTDDPKLDVRAPGAGPSPRPVVLDSGLHTPPTCRLLTHRAAGGRPPVLVLYVEEGADTARSARGDALRAAGAVLLGCGADRRGRVCLQDAWRRLREAGVRSLMVEGGAQVITGLLGSTSVGLVDRLVVTQAGMILGNGVRWAAAGGAQAGRANSFALEGDAIFTWQPTSALPE